MNRKIVAALLAATLLAACTKVAQSPGGSSTPPPRTHVLTIADGTGDIPTLNPHLFTETTLLYIAELTMAYLVRYNSHNEPVPELATVVPTKANGGISPDGKTITWHLRHGVRWSDGAPFTADDVVFSTKVVLNPANNEVGRDGWDLITKIDEPNKYTVVYHLKKPYSSFLPTFFGSAGANPCILPEHILAKYPNINHVPYNSKPVGIGPFRVVSWTRGQSIVLEANPYYWRGEPKLKKIVYKLVPSFDTNLTLMQTGAVQLWPLVPAAFIDKTKAIKTLTTVVQDSAYFAHLDFNVTRPLVRDVRVREAIRDAIDRKALIDKIQHGYGRLQEDFSTPAVPIAPTDLPLIPYDPAAARALLRQAGWRMGPGGVRVKDGKKLVLDLAYFTGSSSADDEVELIRSYLKAVGIEIQTRKYAPALFFGSYQSGGIVYGGKYDMTLFSWQADPNGDMSNFLECDQIPPNGQNNTRYCNPKVDKWMEELKRSYSEAKHRELLRKETEQVIKDVPMITLYAQQFGFAYDRYLTGFHPNAQTPFDSFMNVDI